MRTAESILSSDPAELMRMVARLQVKVAELEHQVFWTERQLKKTPSSGKGHRLYQKALRARLVKKEIYARAETSS